MFSTPAVLTAGLAVAVVLSLSFAGYCLRHRKVRGAVSLSVMFLGIGLWVLADLVQVQTPATATPLFGTEIRLLGPDLTVVGLLLFSVEYTGRTRLASRLTPVVLAIKPLFTVFVLLSPYRHHLVVDVAGGMQYGYEFASTPLYVGYTGYNWVLTVLAILALTNMLVRTGHGYGRQIGAMLAAVSLPFAVNVGYHLDVLGVDLTSSAFLVTAIIFTAATFRLRLLDALPVARRTVLEEMEEMVLVLDESGRIITANAAAREYFRAQRPLAGKHIEELFGEDAVPDIDGGHEEVRVDRRGDGRHLQVTTSTVTDYGDRPIAHVLVCRDVTEKRRREAELREHEEELALLKDLQSRFLRHNLRNELNVVRANAELLVDEGDPDQQRRYQQIAEKTDRILDLGTKARVIEQLVERDDRGTYDANALLASTVDSFRQAHPEVAFDCSLAADADVRAVPQIDHAFENLIENAIEHNDSDQPRVSVSTEREEDTVIVRIADDGPGIDHHELAAMEDGIETPMTHASGFGLWLVYWVVDKSDGDLSFETDDGTTVELRFDAADAHPPEPRSEPDPAS